MTDKVTKRITTNTRVIRDLLTKYKNTFSAFCELINNSLQAKANNIDIYIDYAKQEDLKKSPINYIVLEDDGIGVPYSEFEEKILQIGTTVKKGGQGIGRFGALQIGENVEIETVAFDSKYNQFTKINFPLNASQLKNAQLNQVDFQLNISYLGDKAKNTYYKVIIKDLYHETQSKVSKKNQISKEFLSENISYSIFERYPYQIFNNEVNFKINGEKLKQNQFVIGEPTFKKQKYTDTSEREQEIEFFIYNIKANINKVKVFFYVNNAGLKTVAHEFTYSSDWYTPDLGTWFIYVDSELFNSDLFKNIDLEDLGDKELKKLKEFVKNTINEYFKAKNKKFEKFVNQLENDRAYPYRDVTPRSKTQETVFQKAAYIIEDEYNLIQKDEKIREFLYPLVDKAIQDGHIEDIFKKIMKLSEENLEKFHSLLSKTNLEDVVHFSSQVANKLEFLDFLHELVYGDLSKVLKERSQLHKIIENELWIFGENYNGIPKLWSDKKIENILTEIREKHLLTTPEKDGDNFIEGYEEVEGINNITDLFFFNEKLKDNDKREIMVVELKAPKCAIGKKEMQQIEDYAYTLEQESGLPSEDVEYKVYVVSSRISDWAKSKIYSGRKKYSEPFLFEEKTEKSIKLYAIEWSELIEANKRRLSYLSNQLKTYDKSVKEKFEEEYSELIDSKVSSLLRRIK